MSSYLVIRPGVSCVDCAERLLIVPIYKKKSINTVSCRKQIRSTKLLAQYALSTWTFEMDALKRKKVGENTEDIDLPKAQISDVKSQSTGKSKRTGSKSSLPLLDTSTGTDKLWKTPELWTLPEPESPIRSRDIVPKRTDSSFSTPTSSSSNLSILDWIETVEEHMPLHAYSNSPRFDAIGDSQPWICIDSDMLFPAHVLRSPYKPESHSKGNRSDGYHSCEKPPIAVTVQDISSSSERLREEKRRWKTEL
jgi:hypothetical protein